MDAPIPEEHLDPTLEISLETVKTRALRGIVALTGRTFILNIISVIAQGFLWAFLGVSEFGVFWIVNAVVNFLVYFSDIGLAAALIQKHDKPSDKDLKTTFTIQQILVFIILAVIFLGTPFFKSKYSLNTDGLILLYALGVSLVLSSLKSIPSILLERKLEFGKLIIPQVFETLIYNIVLVFCAWKGLGLMSFTYAVLTREVIGVALLYWIQPWKPGFAISRESLKGLLKFGVPYQINTLLATLKDDGMTLILGGILGPAGVGILGTAQRLSQYPLRFFMDTVTKVTFPAFARMQDDKNHLERSVTRSIFFVCFLVFPSVIGLIIMAPLIMQVIPKYGKWTPALIPLTLVSINTLFAAVTTQLTNLLNAIGKIKTTFKLMVMWLILTWVLIPLLATLYGVNGAALGYGLVGVSSVVAIFIARKSVNFSLNEAVYKPAISTLFMGVLMLAVRPALPVNIFSLIILILVGIAVYILTNFLLIGMELIEDGKKAAKALLHR